MSSMFVRFVALVLAGTALAVSPAHSQDGALDIDRLVASPSLSGPTARGVKISPDGRYVTFLKGKESNFRQTDLWAYEIATGETTMLVDSDRLIPEGGEQLSEAELARRERQRISTTGIVEYQWSKTGEALLFPVSGDIYYFELGGAVRQLTDTDETETDARISPAGRFVSYVRERNLYVFDLASGVETPISTGGGGPIAFGVAQGVVQEELGRFTGYWWSPDDGAVAFTRIDETDVEIVKRPEFTAEGAGLVEQRYPFAGEANGKVRLFVSGLGDNPPIAEIDLGPNDDIYLARVNWAPSGEFLFVQRLSRDQKTLDLLRADAATGATAGVLRETSDTWINVHNDLRFVEDGAKFIWSTERVGYRHLDLHAVDGGRIGRLTRGRWVVDNLVSVDEEAGLIYFMGYADSPLERHLYSVTLDPNTRSIRRLTPEEGWHSASMSRGGGGVFVDNWSDPNTPPQVAIKSLETGEVLSWLEENLLDEAHPYYPYLENHGVKEFGTLNARDGQTLHYWVMKPADFDPEQQYPAVVYTYGGPHGRTVTKSWSLGIEQILVRNGYVVFSIDNRGMWDRGVKFEAPIYRAMGGVEVEDTLRGLNWLKSQEYVDEARVGVWGWSYGGYMTLMLLGKAPGAFAAGVSVAPVTEWRLYDTAYTERYMGMPQAEKRAYDESSPLTHAKNISDPLLVMHGMADDNVFFDNTVKLMAELQEARVPFELMTYPGKKHGIRGEATRAHLWNRYMEFMDRNVKGAE
ncbi:MAG: DPP IV N-terminal domain-containing protein [Pseudomonadota bacterium]